LLADIKQSESLLRTVIDSTPDWIFIKDTQHRFLMTTRRMPPRSGFTNEIVGKDDLELGFPDDLVKGNPDRGIQGFWTDENEILETGLTKYIAEEPNIVDGRSIISVPPRCRCAMKPVCSGVFLVLPTT